MSALICGSLAYDSIMVFNDRFKAHILPDKIHILNVSFLVPTLRREYGGCAGNIAFNLKLLGGRGIPMATAGHDFGPYGEWMRSHGIPTEHIRVIPDQHTAQAFITTDLDDNQITAFHPGAMGSANLNKVGDAKGITIGIVAPEGPAMIEHAAQFAAEQIPFIFDPGQGITLFNGAILKQLIGQSTWICANDYEWQLIQERTKFTARTITKHVQALIVTRGAEGSEIHTKDGTITIPVAKAEKVVDPTGCGDAHRAGILYGLMNKLDWETTGRIASLMGAIKIEKQGTQNHTFTPEEFSRRFKQSFGREFALAA
ncbi:MAG TPA: carbohydrate kinase family protein [Gammaproteobacteria bacterium]|jgi:adenosine kinase